MLKRLYRGTLLIGREDPFLFGVCTVIVAISGIPAFLWLMFITDGWGSLAPPITMLVIAWLKGGEK